MPQSKVRVVGSGFTTFNYRGKPIAFLEEVVDSGQPPYTDGGAPAQAIYSLASNRAEEIITTRVLGTGTLTLTIRELWNQKVWQQLEGLQGVAGEITDIYQALANDPSLVTCQMIQRPPGSSTWRSTEYHNCVITDVDNSEQVTIGAMSMPRRIVIAYTHKTSTNISASGS